MPAAPAIARRLGGPARRKRRHRRVAIGAGVLLAVAAGLIVFGGDDGGFEDDAGAVCVAYADRIQSEFALSFPDGPATPEAFGEYLSHAFADTMDDLLGELDALDPPDGAAAVLDGYRAVLADVRARPADFATASPFDDVAAQMDGEGVPACGSEFFAALQARE